MPSVESIIHWLHGLPPLSLYVALFLVSYIENIFPPSPSDVIMLFIATLIGIGTIDLIPAILIATVGSTLGFMTAFELGRRYGRRWIASERLSFLSKDALSKVDNWFDRYGYWVIVINRFMAGTRAVVSFFAGMSKLDMIRTTLLCTVSALAWNILVIELGAFLGTHWRRGEAILNRYGMIVSIVIGVVLIVFVVRWFLRRKKGTAVVTNASAEQGAAPAVDEPGKGAE